VNLNSIAGAAVQAIRPSVLGSVRVSTGYTTNDDFSRTPTYRDVAGVPMWVDALTYKDIIQVDGLNLNGTRRAIYINGKVDGLVRPENKGGDLITLPTAVFVGAIAADVLTVTSIARGVLSVGDLVSGDDVADATHVSAVLTGIGGVGTYRLDVAQDLASQDLATGQVWLVAMVLEQWGEWCKVAATLQNGS